jgi:hypothetical protein
MMGPRPGSTLALLFLLDCDNMAFRALSTTARRKGGRLILSKAAAELLNYSKTVHIMLVTGAIPLTVAEVRSPGLLAPIARRASIWWRIVPRLQVIVIYQSGIHILAWMPPLGVILLIFPIGGCVEVLACKDNGQREKLLGCLLVCPRPPCCPATRGSNRLPVASAVLRFCPSHHRSG